MQRGQFWFHEKAVSAYYCTRNAKLLGQSWLNACVTVLGFVNELIVSFLFFCFLLTFYHCLWQLLPVQQPIYNRKVADRAQNTNWLTQFQSSFSRLWKLEFIASTMASLLVIVVFLVTLRTCKYRNNVVYMYAWTSPQRRQSKKYKSTNLRESHAANHITVIYW